MILSNVRATLGLNATATLGAAGTSGSIALGQSNQTLNLASATSGYSTQLVFANNGDTTTLNLLQNTHSANTAWVAGAAQAESATAAGTVSAGGNAEVIITAAGMTGSPKTLSVAVATSDTPTLWAAKVRAALAADSAVAAMFTVSGATTAIVLTRKPTHTFTVPGGTLGIYAANDATLNIALATGTATGITTAATSANTGTGVASDGVKIYDGDGNDIEGVDINMTTIHGIQAVTYGTSEITMAGSLFDHSTFAPNQIYVRACIAEDIGIDGIQVFNTDGPASLALTVFGS